MAFYGSHFVFDGKSSEEYGVMLYSFDGTGQDDTVDFTTNNEIYTETLPRRFRNLLYGVENNEPLTFRLVFGAIPSPGKEFEPFEREDVADIAAWLTGYGEYKYLQICQADMENYRYKCIISSLSLISSNGNPYAFECEVQCDSPYAYTLPEKFDFIIDTQGNDDVREINVFSSSTHNGYYMPYMTIETLSDGNISIKNLSDNGYENREFRFEGLTNGVKISVDNENQVLVDETSQLNPYEKFKSFKFIRLVRGDNRLQLQGKFKITIVCEYPVNIGA